MPENYYRILGLSENATSDDIKVAYRKLAKKYHPDKHHGNTKYEEIFKRVSMAYDILSNSTKKEEYDSILAYNKFHSSTESIPNSPKPPRPQSGPKEYTPIAWVYAKIFVLVLITLALLAPYLLFHYTSVFRYEDGLEFEEKGDYVAAVNAYKGSISYWGARNYESTFRIGLILFNNGAPRESVSYFREAFDYTSIDSLEGVLHYKIAQSLDDINRHEEAISELDSARLNGFSEDSIQRLSGKINAFSLLSYQEAEKNFNYLINKSIFVDEAWFGKGWCYQNDFDYEKAIDAYSKAIDSKPNFRQAIFYRGASYYYSHDSIRACTDFLTAMDLGYPLAQSTFKQNCTDSIKSFIPPTEN